MPNVLDTAQHVGVPSFPTMPRLSFFNYELLKAPARGHKWICLVPISCLALAVVDVL